MHSRKNPLCTYLSNKYRLSTEANLNANVACNAYVVVTTVLLILLGRVQGYHWEELQTEKSGKREKDRFRLETSCLSHHSVYGLSKSKRKRERSEEQEEYVGKESKTWTEKKDGKE